MRRLLVVVAFAALVSAGVGGALTAQAGAALVLVSGPSPYAGCTSSPLAPGETNYVNAEVEPWVAVNPASHSNIVGVWQQDRFGFGGARGLVAGYSLDGGATWGETTLPFSVCAPGGVNFERASDPWVSIGPDGRAYAIAISFNESNADNGVVAATSTDGGKTWSSRAIVDENLGAAGFQRFDDKESITADPIHAGVAYAVWDAGQTHNDNLPAIFHTRSFFQPAWLSKTTDGGATWSPAKMIYNPGEQNFTIGNQIVVDPRNGTLYDFFASGFHTGPFSHTGGYRFWEAVIKSTDGGTTWSGPTLIAEDQDIGVVDPNTGAPLRTGSGLPDAAVDPATGALYLVWEDARFSGGLYDEIALSRSTDGGATWSAPLRVNTATGKPAFTPSVEVNSAGKVGVSYYDLRNLTTQTTTLPTDYWLTTSSNGGSSFGSETHIAGPFDELTAPFAFGYFLGDYEGLAAAGSSFETFFAAANSGNTSNRTDIFSNFIP
jgi:hypothetical protein